jgi:hypothetical protein
MEFQASLKAIPSAPPSTKLQAVPLSSRTHLNRVDEGLHGTTGQFQILIIAGVRSSSLCYLCHQGAQKVISQLNTQRSAVTKLTLNHNPLGDDGVSHLFNYLCSTPGSRHRIALSEINLNCTDLGCRGLQAISDYIRGNEVLKALWLASVRARYMLLFCHFPYLSCFRMRFSLTPPSSLLWQAL